MDMFGLGAGFDNYMMNSDEITDTIISNLKEAIAEGYSPMEALPQIMNELNISPADLTAGDKQRIYDEMLAFNEEFFG